MRCEWFKLYLEPRSLRKGLADPRLPQLPVRCNILIWMTIDNMAAREGSHRRDYRFFTVLVAICQSLDNKGHRCRRGSGYVYSCYRLSLPFSRLLQILQKFGWQSLLYGMQRAAISCAKLPSELDLCKVLRPAIRHGGIAFTSSLSRKRRLSIVPFSRMSITSHHLRTL